MPVTVNLDGEITGQLTVPEGVPTGTVLVQFIGNQGSYGETTYTGRSTITLEERRQVTKVTTTSQQVTTVIMQDPLAQTFTLSEAMHIGGIDLWFAEKGTKRIVVQIRETSLGYPTQTVLAKGCIYPQNINVNGNHTRISWDPVFLESGIEYAIVVLTDDPDASLMIAELGKYDSRNGTWVTSQPYQIGVMLSSSNASTWTAHQSADLAFRLLRCKFTENYMEITLGECEAENVSDVIALANVERVSSSTDVEFTLFDDSTGITHKLSEDFPVALQSRITGNLTAKAIFHGIESKSPVLYPGVQLVFGNVLEEADYVTRSIKAGANSKITVTYDAFLQGLADVRVYLKGSGNWILVELTSSQNVGNGWLERVHSITNFNDDEVKVKLVLRGNTLYRPKIQALKVVVI
jgi:hypothetical protein